MDLKKEIVNNRIKVCGLRIKELRTSKNLSLAAFAATVGSSASAITSQTTNRHILSQNRTSLLLECYF